MIEPVRKPGPTSSYGSTKSCGDSIDSSSSSLLAGAGLLSHVTSLESRPLSMEMDPQPRLMMLTGGTEIDTKGAIINCPGGSNTTLRSSNSSSKNNNNSTRSLNGGISDSTLQMHSPSKRCASSLGRSSFLTSSLRINKLRYDAVGLHGRQVEYKAMVQALDNLQSCHQFVFIQGESGTGKTTLARSLNKAITTRNNNSNSNSTVGMMLCGRFDRVYNMPYAAFTQALQEFVGSLLLMEQQERYQSSSQDESENNLDLKNEIDQQDQGRKGVSFNDIQTALIQHIGRAGDPQREVLIQSFPELEEILPDPDINTPRIVVKGGSQPTSNNNVLNESREETTPGQEKSIFHHAFRALLAAISEYVHPLVMVLDDTQWADSASLELLKFLLSDAQQTKKIMIVGCVRSEQMTQEDNLFVKALADLRARQKSKAFAITTFELKNLSVKDCEAVLADLLSMDNDDAKLLELAQVCHSKTQGNPFFLTVFMIRLYQESFLEYQLGNFKWNWSLEEIKGKALATENVADFVLKRMSSLGENALLTLNLAGCLGFRFPYKLLQTLFLSFTACQPDRELDCDESINLLKDEHILQDEDGIHVRWVHSKIEEAAAKMIPEEERGSFKKKMGDIILQTFKLEDLGTSVFIVADLCSEGAEPQLVEERIDVARLNLEAASLASKMTAVDLSRRYAEKGIELLPEDKWTNHEDLACSLYQVACRAVGCLGQYDELEKLANEILDQRQLSIEKRLPVYFSVIRKLEVQSGRVHDAVLLCLDVLRQMGQNFPSRKAVQAFQTSVILKKIKSLTKKLTPEHIRSIPTMTDPHLIMVMRVLDKLGAVCCLSKSPLEVLVYWRSLSLTLKYGISDATPATLTHIGMLLSASQKDFVGSSVFAKHALYIMKQLPNRERVESRVTFLTHFFSVIYVEPISNMAKPLINAYEVGLTNGDVDSAVYSIHAFIIVSLIAGRSLQSLSEDCRTYCCQMNELGRERVYIACKIFWQLILNLIGTSEDHLTLTGQAVDEVEVLKRDPKLHFQVFCQARAMLYAVFAEYALGAQHAVQNSDTFFALFPLYPGVPCTTYYFAIALFAQAQRTKSWVYIRKAKEMMKRMTNYIRKGSPNVGHFVLSLEAEMLVVCKQLHRAKAKFESAIVMAARSGFTHDAAIMNERYGLFLKDVMNDQEHALFHMEEAFKLYAEWGCQKKVDLMLQAYRGKWSSPTVIFTSSNSNRAEKSGELSSLFFAA